MTGGSQRPAIAVAVVVSSRDRAEHLAASLPVIKAALRRGDELVVVDSASGDSSTAAVATRNDVRCERSQRPGLARARNLGVAVTSAPIVVFTDDDCFRRTVGSTRSPRQSTTASASSRARSCLRRVPRAWPRRTSTRSRDAFPSCAILPG